MNVELNGKKSKKQGRDLTVGSIPIHLLHFTWSILLGNFLQTAYSIVNAMWVGKGFGVDAMAAITVSMPIFFTLTAVAAGLTMASGILAAQSYGKKDWKQLEYVVDNSTFLTIIIGIICIIAGHCFANKLLLSIHTEGNILPIATDYLRIFLWTIPFSFGMFLVSSLLRGIGDSTTPLIFQGVSLVLTGILDPILMFGLLGCPRLGLNGTAYATIISQALALISLLIYMKRHDFIILPKIRNMKLNVPISILTLKIGVPSMVQQALVSFGMMIIMGIVNKFGSDCAAAYGVVMRIDQLAFMPSMAAGIAASTLSGQNIGAQLFSRVKDIFKWSLMLGCSITGIASITALLFPHWLMHWFIDDPKVVSLGVEYLRIVGAGYMLFAVMFVSNGVINGAGHTLITTTFTLIGTWLARLPAAEYLSTKLNDPIGIWYGVIIGFVVGTSLSLLYYRSGRWKRPIKRNYNSDNKADIIPSTSD